MLAQKRNTILYTNIFYNFFKFPIGNLTHPLTSKVFLDFWNFLLFTWPLTLFPLCFLFCLWNKGAFRFWICHSLYNCLVVRTYSASRFGIHFGILNSNPRVWHFDFTFWKNYLRVYLRLSSILELSLSIAPTHYRLTCLGYNWWIKLCALLKLCQQFSCSIVYLFHWDEWFIVSKYYISSRSRPP